MSNARQAILIFARSISLDLAQRRWPLPYRRLLRLPRFLSRLEVDVHVFTSGKTEVAPPGRGPIVHHHQTGATFGGALEAAFDRIAALGYERIVIIGRDCPELALEDIETAFVQLETKRMVLGPDHSGGVYLIGLHGEEASLLREVVWQRNTDFEQLRIRVSPPEVAVLAVKQDLDTNADLRRLSRASGPRAALARTLLGLREPGERQLRRTPVPRQRFRERLRWQRPPPSLPTLTRTDL